MDATRVLRDEHDLIEQVLDLVETSLLPTVATPRWSWPLAQWVVDFIGQFADGTHHDKEEQVLFPRLEARGIPRQHGPIGCMLHDHEQGRLLVAAMKRAIQDQNAAAYAGPAQEYVALLRQHIFKENNVLFVMAERCLTDEDRESIQAGYAAADATPERCTRAERFARELGHWRTSAMAPTNSAAV